MYDKLLEPEQIGSETLPNRWLLHQIKLHLVCIHSSPTCVSQGVAG